MAGTTWKQRTMNSIKDVLVSNPVFYHPISYLPIINWVSMHVFLIYCIYLIFFKLYFVW